MADQTIGTLTDSQTMDEMKLTAAEQWALEKTLQKVCHWTEVHAKAALEEADWKRISADIFKDLKGNSDKEVEQDKKDAKETKDQGESLDTIAGATKWSGQLTKSFSKYLENFSGFQASNTESLKNIEKNTAGWQTRIFGFFNGVISSFTMAAGALAKGAGILFRPLGYALEWIVQIAGMLAKNFVALASAVLSVAGFLSGLLLARMQVWWKTWKNLNEQGIRFISALDSGQTSMVTMAAQAAKFNLQTSEFGDLISGALRPAIMLGTEAIGSLSYNVRQSLRDFGQLGLGIGEVNSFLGEYLEGQRITGVLAALDDHERHRRSVSYLKVLTEMTRMTGLSRDQIAQTMKQNQENAMLSGLLFSMDIEQRKAAQKSFEHLNAVFSGIEGGADIMDSLVHGMARGTVATSQFAQDLQLMGRSQEVAMMQRLADDAKAGKLTQDEARKRSFEILQSLKDNLATSETYRAHTLIQSEIGDRMHRFVNSLEGINLKMDGSEFRPENMIELFGNWGETMNKFRTFLDKVITSLLQNEGIGAAMDKFFGGIDETLNRVGDALKGDVADNFIKGLEALGGGLSTVIENVANGLAGAGDGIIQVFTSIGEGIVWAAEQLMVIIGKFSSNLKQGATIWEALFGGEKDIGSGGKTKRIEGALEPLVKAISNAIVVGFEYVFDFLKGKISDWWDDLSWQWKAAIIGGTFALFGGPALVAGVVKGVVGLFKGLGRLAGGGQGMRNWMMGGNWIGGRTERGHNRRLRMWGNERTMMHGDRIMGSAARRRSMTNTGRGIGGAAAGVLGGVGKGLGALGKGLGAGVGLALKGLAVGMAAFANPMTAVGAVAFAGVIVAISGAVAASSWMLGKALPVFTEGIKGFADIDGNKLGETAMGMTALSGALALFGAGSAVAGYGAAIGAIGGAIASLFGGDSPIESLEKFAGLRIDNDQLERNISGMVLLGEGIRSMEGIADIELPPNTVRWFKAWTGFDFGSLTDGMASIAGVSGFREAATTLSTLEVSNIDATTDAMRDLTGAIRDFIEIVAEMQDINVPDINVRGNPRARVAGGGAGGASSSAVVGELQRIGTKLTRTNENLDAIRKNTKFAE